MKHREHKKIVTVVSSALGLSREQAAQLRKSVVLPDIERRKWESHHRTTPERIFALLKSSRAALLGDTPDIALDRLGRALHYVHDRCSPGTRVAGEEAHEEIERELAECEIRIRPSELDRDSAMSFTELSSLIREPILAPRPQDMMDDAVRISFHVVQSVLSAKEMPDSVRRRIERATRRHYRFVLPAGLAAGIGISALLALWVPWILGAMVGLTFFGWILTRDAGFRAVRNERAWYAEDQIRKEEVSEESLASSPAVLAGPFARARVTRVSDKEGTKSRGQPAKAGQSADWEVVSVRGIRSDGRQVLIRFLRSDGSEDELPCVDQRFVGWHLEQGSSTACRILELKNTQICVTGGAITAIRTSGSRASWERYLVPKEGK